VTISTAEACASHGVFFLDRIISLSRKKAPEQERPAQGRDISRGTTLIATFSFKLPLVTESNNPCSYYGEHPSVPTTCSKHQLQSVFTYPLASAHTNRRLSEGNLLPYR